MGALTTPLQVLKTCYLEPLAPFDLAVTPAVLRWFSGTRSGWPARDLHDSQWRERSKWLKKCSQKLAHKSPTTVLLGHWLAPNRALDTKSMKSAWVCSSKLLRNTFFFKGGMVSYMMLQPSLFHVAFALLAPDPGKCILLQVRLTWRKRSLTRYVPILNTG